MGCGSCDSATPPQQRLIEHQGSRPARLPCRMRKQRLTCACTRASPAAARAAREPASLGGLARRPAARLDPGEAPSRCEEPFLRGDRVAPEDGQTPESGAAHGPGRAGSGGCQVCRSPKGVPAALELTPKGGKASTGCVDAALSTPTSLLAWRRRLPARTPSAGAVVEVSHDRCLNEKRAVVISTLGTLPFPVRANGVPTAGTPLLRHLDFPHVGTLPRGSGRPAPPTNDTGVIHAPTRAQRRPGRLWRIESLHHTWMGVRPRRRALGKGRISGPPGSVTGALNRALHSRRCVPLPRPGDARAAASARFIELACGKEIAMLVPLYKWTKIPWSKTRSWCLGSG